LTLEHRSELQSERQLDLLGTWVRVLSLRTRLLKWYDRNRRDLPWRADRDPYRVLVSELMLQQTRVDVVVPYFERWVARWPDFASLAAAAEDEVLAAWSGLGYYRRARALLVIARTVDADLDGTLPEDPDVLRELPGIGPCTSAATASIAYGVPVPVVDGNVERRRRSASAPCTRPPGGS
jgi:A/G-specific adenine glycosylase